MVIFHSYVSLPEGTGYLPIVSHCIPMIHGRYDLDENECHKAWHDDGFHWSGSSKKMEKHGKVIYHYLSRIGFYILGGAAILLPDPLWLAPLTPWPTCTVWDVASAAQVENPGHDRREAQAAGDV